MSHQTSIQASEEMKQTDVSVNTKHQTLQGVAFPVSQYAFQVLEKLSNKQLNYVQLEIDRKNETIILANTENTELKDLSKRIPKNSARLSFFLYKHSHEGDYLESVVFIYSIPGYTCSIRERMLYSSCKSPLLEIVERQLQMNVIKKIELDNGDELTEVSFMMKSSMHISRVLLNQKVLREREGYED